MRRARDSILSEGAEAVLRQRAVSLAQRPDEEPSGDRLALLLFRVGVEWYAVDLRSVREICREFSVTPLPCVPEHILGVMNVRGEILSVTDLALMMGLGPAAVGSGRLPAIVLSGDQAATAVIVDEIGDIVEVPEDDLEGPVSTIDRQQAEFVSGSAFVNGILCGLVKVDRVLEPVGGASRY